MIEAGQLRELLRYDPSTGELSWRRRPDGLFPSAHAAKIWNANFAEGPAFTTKNRGGYFKGMVFRKTYSAHRVIWALVTGSWPSKEIDHINGDRGDNRWANLREATKRENGLNRGPMPGKRYRGVFRRYGLWHARCAGLDGRVRCAYGFASEEEAARAVDRLASQYQGQFFRPNFPTNEVAV